MSIRYFERKRVVEVIFAKINSTKIYGSGYRIGGGLVLTAAHPVDDGAGNHCEVRWFAQPLESGEEKDKVTSPAKVVWRAQNCDIALIELPNAVEKLEPIILGKLPEGEKGEKVTFQMSGYPRLGVIEGVAQRLQYDGTIYLSDSAFWLRVSDPLNSEFTASKIIQEITKGSQEKKSEWEGMSGAAVICDCWVVAVQKRHQRPMQPNHIEATPVSMVYGNEQWQQLLEKHGINPKLETASARKEIKKLAPLEYKSPRSIFDIPREQLDFVGREREISAIETHLFSDSSNNSYNSSVILRGSPGVGKSRLARHFATAHKSKFPIVKEFAMGSDKENGHALAIKIAKACGVEIDFENSLDEEETASTLMSKVFENYKALILLDNVNAPESIRKLLPPKESECTFIITTLAEGLAEDLDIPEVFIETLPPDDSKDLFIKAAGKDENDFTESELNIISNIAVQVGHLPLALKILGTTAKRGRTTLKEISEKLQSNSIHEDEESRLDDIRGTSGSTENFRKSCRVAMSALESWCTSRAVEEEGDEAIGEQVGANVYREAVRFFFCLSACAEEGFSRETAEAVSEFSSRKSDAYLKDLCGFSLIDDYEAEKGHRYKLHSLLRDFAWEQAERPLLIDGADSENAQNLREGVRNRHAQYFREFVEKDGDGSYEDLNEEIHNITLALRWLKKKEIFEYSFFDKLHTFFERFRYWEKGEEFMCGVQAFAKNQEDWEQSAIFGIRAARYISSQSDISELKDVDLECAQKDIERAEEIITSLKPVIDRIEQKEKKLSLNIKWLSRYAMILQKKEKLIAQSLSYTEQTNQFDQIRQSNQVIDDLQSTLEAAEKELSDDLLVRNSYHALSVLLRSKAYFLERDARNKNNEDELKFCRSQLIDVSDKVLELSKKLGNEKQIVLGYRDLASAFKGENRLEDAIAILRDLEEIVRNSISLENDKTPLEICLYDLGGLLRAKGLRLLKEDETLDAADEALDAAIACFNEQIDISRSCDNHHLFMGGLIRLIRPLIVRKKLEEAFDKFKQAVSLIKCDNDRENLCGVGENLAKALKGSKKYEKSQFVYEKCISLHKQLHDDLGTAKGHNLLGGLYLKQNKHHMAITEFDQQIKIGNKLNNDKDRNKQICRGARGIGSAQLQIGEIDKGLQSLEDSLKISNDLSDRVLRKNVFSPFNIYVFNKNNQISLEALLIVFFNKISSYQDKHDQKRIGNVYFLLESYLGHINNRKGRGSISSSTLSEMVADLLLMKETWMNNRSYGLLEVCLSVLSLSYEIQNNIKESIKVSRERINVLEKLKGIGSKSKFDSDLYCRREVKLYERIGQLYQAIGQSEESRKYLTRSRKLESQLPCSTEPL